MIHLHQISKSYRKVKALNQVTINFEPGQSIALIGPNGAGKTTLIKCILGMVKPDEGTLTFDGEQVNNHWLYRRKIGYMPQIGRYPDNIKVGQLFSLMQKIRGNGIEKTDDELFRFFRLANIERRAMHGLSGGMRQKVGAALAFYFDPPVLILDEPTAGLDPMSSEYLKTKIAAEKKKGKLIIITSHILSDLDDIVSHVLYIEEGKIVFFKSIDDIRKETSQQKLSRAILTLIKEQVEYA